VSPLAAIGCAAIAEKLLRFKLCPKGARFDRLAGIVRPQSSGFVALCAVGVNEWYEPSRRVFLAVERRYGVVQFAQRTCCTAMQDCEPLQTTVLVRRVPFQHALPILSFGLSLAARAVQAAQVLSNNHPRAANDFPIPKTLKAWIALFKSGG